MNIIKQSTDKHMPDKESIRINVMTSVAPRRPIKVYAVIAVVLILAICTTIAVPMLVNDPKPIAIPDTDSDTERVTLSTSPTFPWDGIDEPDEGIYIPEVKLALPEPGVMMDMLGFVVYGDKLYTQAEYILCDYDQKEKYIGEYLGTAKGNCNTDCIGKPDPIDLTEDFTSNATGDVYTVKGYNPAFRICIPEMYKGCGFIAFFECLNGITLATGEDLYGSKRLNVIENYNKVYSCPNAYEYYPEDRPEPIELSEEAMTMFPQFIDKLLISEFTEYRPEGTLYSREHIMLYIEMKDGSTAEIGLFPDGYVHYFNMHGYVMVKMEDSVFNEFYSMIK